VSRRHAYLKKENEDWVLYDNGSTNGVKVNDTAVPRAVVKDGDQVVIGTFVLRFRDEPTLAKRRDRLIDSTSTCIRPIAEFNQDFGLDRAPAITPESTMDRKRVVLDVAYKNGLDPGRSRRRSSPRTTWRRFSRKVMDLI
jgi:pSer/pThr/pTyr-binding forkhead associated (FHA) protein